ncbi:MAG: magnesium transporter CorA family protein [Candidatus Pacebacteria bacterium]|nr:magnesium transporter CorA family protein [Candidatus Paceibacterota bacterium]
MIKYLHRTVGKKMRQPDTFHAGSLVIVKSPTEEELEFLIEEFNLEAGLLADALDPYESPRLEFYKNNAYIFFRIPNIDKSKDKFSTFPALLVIGSSFILMISAEDTEFLLENLKRKKDFHTSQRLKLFLQIFNEIELRYNHLLVQINRKINYFSFNIEKVSEKDIANFVRFEIILNEFLSALLPMRHILKSISAGKGFDLYKEDKDILDDLELINEQMTELCKSNINKISTVRKSYEVISTNKLNRTMKLLTTLTVVLALPTMITSFYGMNVPLPFSGNGLVFWYILSFALLLIVSLLLVFKFRRKI